MNLDHEKVLTLEWHPYNVQPYTYVVLATIANKILIFALKRGLAWWEMVRFDWKPGYEPGPKLHEP